VTISSVGLHLVSCLLTSVPTTTQDTDHPVPVYFQPAHYSTLRGGCVISNSCVSTILQVIILVNRESAYTISLAINMTTDSNNIRGLFQNQAPIGW
jgi:hypothetical protein